LIEAAAILADLPARGVRRQSQPALVATQRDPRTDRWPQKPYSLRAGDLT
jgi:hypothetical protein